MPARRLFARLLLSAGLLGGAASAVAAQDAAAEPAFTVVTLDLGQNRDDWPDRRGRILAWLRRLRPDAIALQDVLQHEALPNQAASLATALGYEWLFVTTDPPSQERRQGMALLTRQAPLEQGETLLHPRADRRAAGFVRLAFGGRPLNIYFVQLNRGPEGAAMRARQLSDLLAYVEATSDGAPSLIAGGFNAEADAPELEALRERWVDAWGALHPHGGAMASSTLDPTCSAHPARVDHVFLEAGRLQPLQARPLSATAGPDSGCAPDPHGLLVALRLVALARPTAAD